MTGETQQGAGERPGATVSGLLLCRAADGLMAFPARDVVVVEAWTEDRSSPHARQAFGFSPQAGRSLVSSGGEAVGVDEVSVHAEPVAVLSSPALLRAALGGSLLGFVLAREKLWPLLQLASFSRFLASPEGPR